MRLGDCGKTNLHTYSDKEKWSLIRYLDTGSITEGRIDEIQTLYPGVDKIPSRARRKASVGDILFSTVRPNQKHYGIIEAGTENLLVSTGFTVVTVDTTIADPYFIYYYLTQSSVIESLQAIAEQSTSTYPSIKPSDIEDIELDLPELETQKKIGSTLRMLDRKIALNEEINDNLQQQAKALYAEMFLGSSNDDVISGTLSDIAVITMGQSPSGSSYNEDGVGEVFYQGRAEFGFRFPKRRLFTTEPKRMAETGDVLLSVRAPVGDLNVAYERCCIGRGLGAIHSKTGHSSFVLYTMFALRSQLDVFNGEGTVFGSINRDALNAIPIDIPPVTEINQFEAVAHPIDELIRANYEENCRLEAIRDSLIPKLMSGEIDVSAVQL